MFPLMALGGGWGGPPLLLPPSGGSRHSLTYITPVSPSISMCRLPCLSASSPFSFSLTASSVPMGFYFMGLSE